MSVAPSLRVRREPPAFRELAVVRTAARSPFLRTVTLGGRSLDGFEMPLPAGSVRLLLPDVLGGELVIPVWNGNAFVHEDGRRPVIRTLTPLRHDADAGELDVEVVLHGTGPLSEWAAVAQAGDVAAVSGPGRGYTVDPDAPTFVIAGDESAIPAIGQLLEALPPTARTTAVVEVAHPDARLELTDRGDMDVRWVDRGSGPGEALASAVAGCEIDAATRVWAAGEAASMQRIRRHLFGDVGVDRGHATVRGYWKHGRDGDDDDPEA